MEKLIIEDGDETLVLEANDYECRQGLFYDCPLKSLYLGRNLSYGYDSSPFKNTLTEVSIGNSVTSIGGYAFLGCSGLTSITIPNSVTSIGNLAFYGCSGLTSVTIPTSVTSIGNNAFKDCAALEKLIIEDGQETLKLGDNGWRSGLFYDCPLKYLYLGRNVSYDYSPFPNKPTLTEVSIGNTVTTIEKSAFSGSSSLTSVTIPNSVTTIGESAFSGYSGLISIGIPNSVTVIGGGAFSGCSGLTGITIPNSVTSIENDAFKGCTALEKFIIEDGTETLKLGSNYNDCPLKYLYLGRNYIGVLPSDNKSTLTEVGIGNLVTSIGGRVFDGCTALEKLTIEDGDEILELADLKFSNCPLKYLYIGRKLSDYSFNNKPTLTEVGIGNSVINIVDGMFEGCSGLTGITIPNSVTSIGNGAFNGCAALEKLIIEDGNDTLTLGYNYKGGGYFPGKGLFYDCPLKCLYLGRTLSYPNTKYEGYSPFYNISTLTEMSIGNSVTSIGNYAFNGCTGLTSVTIPNSVTGIEESAFRDCSGLTSVTIGNSVAGIGSSAFRGCSGLTSVTIPNSVTSIKGWVFGECSSLATIYSFNPIPPGAYNSSFNPLFESAILYVPNEAVETYKATFPWNKFRKIQSFDQTGIYGVEADDNSRQDVYYDLNGHRLSTSKKGLNIINGKKVIIK